MTEECERLLTMRDRVDEVRDRIPRPIEEVYAWHWPTSRQQRELFNVTRDFFEAYYSALSSVSGVIARFVPAFGVNFSDNGPLLKWARAEISELTHDRSTELERARVFRALLAHPQQFPAYDWLTATRDGYEYIHVVLIGPKGRGKNPYPPGTSSEPFAGHGDWHFEAPDEVSVSNCLMSLALSVLARVWVAIAHRSHFHRQQTVEYGLRRLNPAYLDLGAHARGVQSVRDLEDLPPASELPAFR
ncbi:hypothetical protein GCM10011600_01450 [Pseudolysinimonas yzui]|uniref:Uncharacterized protein n=2 Tax=Pseudolysinimonas yzui TaxID=2708254 RepID=A0A8J3DU44_9MICO|nr:hypothetical protein GCM10011600_01450 [Pseudolysinimonas yzui]